MKKSKPGKLVLSVETLRELEARQLKNALGGQAVTGTACASYGGSCYATCIPTCACVTLMCPYGG